MTIDYEKVLALTGRQFSSAEDFFMFMQYRIAYIATHSETVTKPFYSVFKWDMLNLLECVSFD